MLNYTQTPTGTPVPVFSSQEEQSSLSLLTVSRIQNQECITEPLPEMTKQQGREAGQADAKQVQVTLIIETLSTLSSHPDFQAGLRDAEEQFLEDYDAAPLSEDEMIEKVEGNLSRSVIERCRKMADVFGMTPPSYLYNLGFVFGTINEGLTYSYQVC